MTFALFLKVLFAAIEQGTPLLYATLGAIITERSGVLNLGVEGMMIVAAFAGFFGLHLTGNPWLGLLAAGSAAAFMGSLHGVVYLVFQGNQVVSGLALTILGLGLADFLGAPYIGTVTKGFDPIVLPWLSSLPVLGPVMFTHDVLVYISFLLAPVAWFMLTRTRWGLALCATGENPQAVAAAGLSPVAWRWVGIVVGGFLIGCGGGYLSLASSHEWTHSISAGRGWIAIALVIFSFWRPGRAVLGAYLFCGVSAFQLRLQSAGVLQIPTWLLDMFPYLLTLLVLLLSSARGKGRAAPKALGVNLEPGA